VLAMQRAAKQTFDPVDVFNPGEVVGDQDP
jgi:hypothetical protein